MLCCAVNVGGEIVERQMFHLNVAVTGDHVLFAFLLAYAGLSQAGKLNNAKQS